MILLDTTHTSHSGARTGVQRVVRALAQHLPTATPVTFDPFAGNWRGLTAPETQKLLSSGAPPTRRSASWPLPLRLSGWLARAGLKSTAPLPAAEAALLPEIFSPSVFRALPGLRARLSGPVGAVFHDALALKLPHLSPAGTVARFPHYLRELTRFDGIAAVSDHSKNSLLEFWDWAGVRDHPPVATVPLGIDAPAVAPAPPPPGEPTLLCVGTIEGRKNHLSLLEACESLWKSGRRFRLELVGRAHRVTGSAALARIGSLARLYPLFHYSSAGDDALEAAYARCSFTVYPSLMEGFGLPVLESIARHRPCICGAGGALAEAAPGGGCISLPSVDPATLATAIASLLDNPGRLEQLAIEACGRKSRTWQEYALDIASWLRSQPRRAC